MSRLNVERMRRHQRRTMSTRISQPREVADLSTNPYLTEWAREMGRRFGPWIVTLLDDPRDPFTATFTAEPDRRQVTP